MHTSTATCGIATIWSSGASPDYWATPNETMNSGTGDCEDYAILKYFVLTTMGVSPAQLRIAYVAIETDRRTHMVLTYAPSRDGETLVLDNMRETVAPTSDREDLTPIYSFNRYMLWKGLPAKVERPVGNPLQLAPWRAMERRMARVARS